MLHIVCRAEKSIDTGAAEIAVCFEFTDTQKKSSSALRVMNLAPSRCGIGRCGAVTLPVEQRFTDGIIVVHGRR